MSMRWDTPTQTALVIRAPEIVDAVNRLIAELRLGRTSTTGALDTMSKAVDDLIITAHMTMDTETAAGEAINKILQLMADAQGDPAKLAALSDELVARRLILAQAIANVDATLAPPVVDPALTTTVDPNVTPAPTTAAPETTATPDTTAAPDATTPEPTTTEAGITLG